MREQWLKANIAEGLRAPKAAKKLPELLDVDAAAPFVESPRDADADNGDELFTLRDAAILDLFYNSGLRLSELTGLNWKIWTCAVAKSGLSARAAGPAGYR